jgi:Fe-Mn family superoxide dismutase
MEDTMVFELPRLPYSLDALEPHLSRETLEFHYGKHHKAYLDKLNAAIDGTKYEKMALDDIVRESVGRPHIFNNAAQAWNHTFYWFCLSPNGGGEPRGALGREIEKAFGSFNDFHDQFTRSAAEHFGSGWTWLVRRPDGNLVVQSTHDAGNPMTDGDVPLLACDVWEHAYYIDYRNARPAYIDAFWKIVDWEFVEKKLQDPVVTTV